MSFYAFGVKPLLNLCGGLIAKKNWMVVLLLENSLKLIFGGKALTNVIWFQYT